MDNGRFPPRSTSRRFPNAACIREKSAETEKRRETERNGEKRRRRNRVDERRKRSIVASAARGKKGKNFRVPRARSSLLASVSIHSVLPGYLDGSKRTRSLGKLTRETRAFPRSEICLRSNRIDSSRPRTCR